MKTASIAIAAALVSAAGSGGGEAFAQCTSTWDRTAGLPGLSAGYAAPIRGWNERIYVGGSFSGIGGVPGTAYLGAYNPQSNSWSSVGTGISGGFTNAFMTAMLPYNPPTLPGGERLVVAGWYATAGGLPNSACLAMWNGASWETMGAGWDGNNRSSIWSLAVWNGVLYVGGGVISTTIGQATPWNGIASWNGTAWESLGSGIVGSSPTVFALAVYNDGSGEALYAAGRFNSMNDVPGTSQIARWNGSNWSSVGGGLPVLSPFFGPEAMVVFDDGSGPALFVAGYQMAPPGASTCNVAKWNGQWSAVGGVIGTGRLTSMAAFDDGDGETLYIGGTAMPGINYFARLVNGQWQIVDGGITGPGNSGFPSVFGMGVVGDKLYIGGNFTQVNNEPANGLAARTSCAVACYANCDGSTIPPVLNVADFSCFLAKFAAGDGYANCDGSTIPPVLNVADFSCFLAKFAAGCP
jgi:trimeric autotransporter adhesin